MIRSKYVLETMRVHSDTESNYNETGYGMNMLR